jgi:hypothetical protein
MFNLRPNVNVFQRLSGRFSEILIARFVVLDGTSWRVRDEFEDFQDKAGEGEDVARRVVATTRWKA